MGQVALNSPETGNRGSPARAAQREHKENPSSGLHTTGRRCQLGKRWTARSRCLNQRFHRPQRNLWKGAGEGGGGGDACVYTPIRGSRVSEDVSSVPTGGVKTPGKNKENKIPEVRLAAYINCASADTLDSQTQRSGFV